MRNYAVHAILGSALALPTGVVAFKAQASSYAPHRQAWSLLQVPEKSE
jgi:hypothetical protein